MRQPRTVLPTDRRFHPLGPCHQGAAFFRVGAHTVRDVLLGACNGVAKGTGQFNWWPWP